MNPIEIEETIVSKEIRNIKSVFNDDTLTEKELLEVQKEARER